jgi:hypothetical protein
MSVSREVFVSYSQPDHECAFELVSRLESQNISTWIAPRDISPSADWAAEIIDGISSARLMVLVFSFHSNQSPQVHREVERAVHKRVPFRIENVAPTRSLEYFISSQHWLDAFTEPREAHYRRLCAHIEALLGRTDPEPAARAAVSHTVEQQVLPSHPVPSLSISVAERAFLEKQLAHHLGPVASCLVKRALRTAKDLRSLTQQLAAEIDSDRARRQFLDAFNASGDIRQAPRSPS